MKLTLFQKGIILVSIPLAFEILFVSALAFLNLQGEEEANRAFHSALISNCSNSLVRNIFEAASLMREEMFRSQVSEQYKRAIADVRSDFQQLLEAVENSPSEYRTVQRSEEAFNEAYHLAERVQSQSTSNILAMTASDALRDRLRMCVKRLVSPELLSMAQNEKDAAEASHRVQALFTRRITITLIIGVLFNVVLTIFVAKAFGERIINRLNTILDNTRRLACEMPLNPSLAGEDEIANVDKSFHLMAAALTVAKRKEKALIAHSLDIISSIDATGRITSINPACKEVTGYSEDEMRGRNLRQILPPADVDVLRKSLTSPEEEQAAVKFESNIKHKEGKDVCVSWSMHWVPDEREFFCVGHDITARKETERLKQEFLAMISHDLRTPLATLSNFLEMLESGIFGDLSDRGNHLIRVAASSANRMKSLINDLLDLDKAESGRLQLDCSLTRLDDLLDQSVNSVAGLASKEEVQLELTNIELEAYLDPKRISQVLVNLLSNAIKFSPKGGVIKISAQKLDDKAVVSISDQGRGVPENMKQSIFERFQQVKISDAVDKGGSGLGLAICKNIIELHGGTIKVENNKNGPGSTFSFNLPLSNNTAVV